MNGRLQQHFSTNRKTTESDNESSETEEKKIRNGLKKTLKNTKEQTEHYPKVRRLDRNKYGAPNWSKQHGCPARGKKRIKCGELGHYAKCRRLARKINHIVDEEAYNADEDDWIPDRMHSIQQKIHSMGTKSKNGLPFDTKTLLVINRTIKFIVDTGSPVTIIPKARFNEKTTIRPVLEEYGYVNGNKKKIERKTMANIEIDGKVKQLELLITIKQTHPLLGLNWMKKLGITLKTEAPYQTVNHINKPDQINNRPDADITTLKTKFDKLFTKNHTINNVEVDIQLKEELKQIPQKGRPIPYHLQPAKDKESEKLKTKQEHIEQAKNIDENCFVSPTVQTSRERPKSAPYLRLKKTKTTFFLQLETTKVLKKLKIEKQKFPNFSRKFFEVSGKSHSAKKCKGGRFGIY